MANAIDGIGAINVNTLVTQLMSVEGGQQTLLSNQQSAVTTQVTALQLLNSTVGSIRTAAEAIVGSVLSPKAWTDYSAASSTSSVAASASSSATPGTYSFDVTSVAASHKTLYGGTLALTAAAAGTDPVTVTQNGATTTLDLKGDTTLQGVINAVNTTDGLGVKASAVKVADGSYRLQLSATKSGAANAFTVSGLDASVGSAAVLSQGADAAVKYGPGAGDVLTSSSNTFTDLFAGVTFTVSKPETGVTLTVADDAGGMSDTLSKLVDSINTALNTMTSQTAYNATKKTAGPLTGNPLPESLTEALTSAVFSAVPGATLKDVGIQLDRSGKLSFDSSAFTAKLASDPDKAKSMAAAFATAVGTVAKRATDVGSGTVTTAISTAQDRSAYLTERISDWDTRLSAKKEALLKQFSALNTQLTAMQEQSSWLTSQIAALPSYSTS